jgi:hypothetical protein
MSLLQDQDYVISHLRATYLESCGDSVGERVIRPSHLYITKTGPKQLNWAASTLLSKARPDSPPIPTDTLSDHEHIPLRRGSNAPTLEEDEELTHLRAEARTKSTTRRRASTLPSMDYQQEQQLSSRSRGLSINSDNSEYYHYNPEYYNNSSNNMPNDTDDDESYALTTVYERDDLNDQESSLADDGSPYPNGGYNYAEEGDDEGEDGDDDDDDEEDEDEEEGSLSGLSEEDDSDIEEELEYAARQIKKNANAAEQDMDSTLGSSRPASTTTSPRTRKHSSNRKDSQNSRRHRSIDLTISPNLPNPNATGGASGRQMSNSQARSRTMSTKSGGSASDLHSPQPPFAARNDTDNTSNTSAASSAHEKLEIGLGLRKVSSATSESLRDRSLSLLGPALKAPLKPSVRESKLTSQIRAKQSTFDNPLEQYIAASGKSERKPVRLKMYMPTCSQPKEPWEAVVRTDVNVHLAIGFALYCYSEQKRQPELSPELCDANKWNLRIVEEDGEPDEDFPALDRTRLISAYSFDEFAMCEATPEQAKENERITPNSKKASKPPDATRKINQQPQEEQQQEDKTPEQEVELFIFKYPFSEMTSQVFWQPTFSSNTTLREVLEQLCQEKMLDHTMYAFKMAGTRMVVANSLKISALEGQHNLELTPRRVMTRANGYVEDNKNLKPDILSPAANTKAQNVYTALAMKGAEDAKQGRKSMLAPANMIPEVLSAAGYQKYKIWRRQPMSFNSRHERILAIDGEYVHIMPSEDKTYIESPKTSSFHISQVMKCKQSRKIPANFKIVVRKTSGPKRYDLEATSTTQSAEIVSKVRSLAANYGT